MKSHNASLRASSLALAALLMPACGDDAPGEPGTKMDAGRPNDAAVARDDATMDGATPSSPTDGSTKLDANPLRDGSTQDGSTTRDGASSDAAGDAASDAGMTEACFRPFSIPDDGGIETGPTGCACGLDNGSGYCVPSRGNDGSRGYEAVLCFQGRWTSVSDGPCFPSAPAEPAQCASAGGTVVPSMTVSDAGTTMLAVCPTGSHLLGGVKGGGLCCAPLEASRAECSAAGFAVFESPSDAGLSPDRCPAPRRVRAHIPADVSGPSAVCCQ